MIKLQQMIFYDNNNNMMMSGNYEYYALNKEERRSKGKGLILRIDTLFKVIETKFWLIMGGRSIDYKISKLCSLKRSDMLQIR